MASRLVCRLDSIVARLGHALAAIFGRNPPPGASYCLAGVDFEPKPLHTWSLKDVFGDGFLWAVPKSRRTIEKRLKRKFGCEKYVLKILKPKTTLKVCKECGDDHEVGVLCPTCYKKVMDETRIMQEQIQEELQLSPVDKEVVVLYDGEKESMTPEYWKGKRIIEMKRPRPLWFSKNLTQQTTQQPAVTTDIKPSKLG